VKDTNTAPRWDVLLPLIATGVAGLMVALAFLSLYAFRQREALALDGRVFGLAHDAEVLLRESGRDAPGEVLEGILTEGQPEVQGLVLSDPNGAVLATAGTEAKGFHSRTVDLLVGPGLRSGSGPPGPPPERWSRGQAAGPRGRGRLVLEFILDPSAGSPPLVIRLLLPAAIAVSIGLIGLAFLGGRLLVRQRREALREAQQRRLEALARAGAGLAHQLRTPLATIKGSCQLVGEQIEDSPLFARLQTTVDQAGRMERMLSMLLDFARPPEPQVQTIDVSTILAEVAARRPHVRLAHVDDSTVVADPEHLAQILDNVVDNAEAFSPAPGSVEISALSRHCNATIIVADRGPGPGPDPEELFEPYVTTRADGTGLGLAIARNLAEANGGGLVLRPREGGGCEAVLSLPRAGGAG